MTIGGRKVSLAWARKSSRSRSPLTSVKIRVSKGQAGSALSNLKGKQKPVSSRQISSHGGLVPRPVQLSSLYKEALEVV